MSNHVWTATILASSPRYANWMKVFGTPTVPLEGPAAVTGQLPGLGESRVYMVAVRALSTEQLARAVAHLSRAFTLSEDEVRQLLFDPAHGLPILEEDVTVPIPTRFLI